MKASRARVPVVTVGNMPAPWPDVGIRTRNRIGSLPARASCRTYSEGPIQMSHLARASAALAVLALAAPAGALAAAKPKHHGR